MDIEKEREAFERLPLAELAIKCKYVYYSEKTNSYWPNDEGFCPSDAPEAMNFAWQAWQAAKVESHKQAALYQFEINHLAQANQQWREKAAKAQAVPDGFVLVPKEPTPKMIDATWNFDEKIQDMSHNSRNEFIYNAMIAVAQDPAND